MLPPTPPNEHERLEVLARVPVNLVMNAGDAMPEGGTAFLPSATGNPAAHHA